MGQLLDLLSVQAAEIAAPQNVVLAPSEEQQIGATVSVRDRFAVIVLADRCAQDFFAVLVHDNVVGQAEVTSVVKVIRAPASPWMVDEFVDVLTPLPVGAGWSPQLSDSQQSVLRCS